MATKPKLDVLALLEGSVSGMENIWNSPVRLVALNGGGTDVL